MVHMFAHAGHDHTEEMVTQTPPGFFDSIYGVIFINLAPFVLLALVLVVMRRVLKVPFRVQLLVTLLYLLLVGLLGYRYVPVASIISLVAGFGLALALMILPFKRRE